MSPSPCHSNGISTKPFGPREYSGSWYQLSFLFLCLPLILSSCATTSLFIPYPAQIQPIRELIIHREYDKAQKNLSRHLGSRDRLLYLMERGRIAQMAGEYEASIQNFRKAIALLERNEEKARITLTGSGAQTAALLTNDNALPYTGEPYERIFIHQFQALNYLFSGNREAALVEVRRANLEQQVALQRHERELAKAEEMDRERALIEGHDAFSALRSAAGQVKNSIQNAYTFYLSGLVYESAGELNDAYIDYRKALEIRPDNPYLVDILLRLTHRLDFSDDHRQLKEAHALPEPREPSADEGEIVVLFEQGFVPAKSEITIPLWIDLHHVEQRIALPTYRFPAHTHSPLILSLKGDALGETWPIVQVEALAARALEDRLPAIILRQTLRFAAKRKLSYAAGKKWGEHAELAMEVFNFVTEQADRRSWLTLPDNAQILRSILPAGRHQLQLGDREAGKTVEIEIRPGRVTLLHLIDTEGIFHHDWIIM